MLFVVCCVNAGSTIAQDAKSVEFISQEKG